MWFHCTVNTLAVRSDFLPLQGRTASVIYSSHWLRVCLLKMSRLLKTTTPALNKKMQMYHSGKSIQNMIQQMEEKITCLITLLSSTSLIPQTASPWDMNLIVLIPNWTSTKSIPRISNCKNFSGPKLPLDLLSLNRYLFWNVFQRILTLLLSSPELGGWT